MDDDEIRRRLEEIFGPPTPRRPPLTSRTLDDILASRTHVRVLRVLVAEENRTNLTGRDLAGRANASRARIQEVLRHLCLLGLVCELHASTHTIYHLADEHPLIGAVRSLFDEERRTGQSERRSGTVIVDGSGRDPGHSSTPQS